MVDTEPYRILGRNQLRVAIFQGWTWPSPQAATAAPGPRRAAPAAEAALPVCSAGPAGSAVAAGVAAPSPVPAVRAAEHHTA
ncbi:hypothetical protein [Streptomyces sp. NPDC001537]